MTTQHAPHLRPVRRGLGLIRVSKEREGMTSPEVQRHAIQQYADTHGINIIGWVEGIDESGSSRASAWWPKLDASINRVEAGEVDAIIVWKFSRVGRQRLKWALALDRVDVAGGSIESATEQADATPSGRFARGMLGELNAYQSELIGETWREAHQRRIRAGLPPTGGPRFGYQIIDGHYEPDPIAGPVLAEAYAIYLRGGGWRTVARHIDAHAPREGGGPRCDSRAARILDSGFGAGLLHRAPAGSKKRPDLHPITEREYLQGSHPAVITPETWAAYVAERTRRRNGSRTRPNSPYLLTGLMRCADCEGPMHGGKQEGRPVYLCTRGVSMAGHRGLTITGAPVEAMVTEWLFSLATDAAREAANEAGRTKHRDLEFTRRRAAAQLRQADDRLLKLTLKLADGTISDEAYKLAAEGIRAERDAAAKSLEMAAHNPEERRAAISVPDNIEEIWAQADTQQRTAILRTVLGYVTVTPANSTRQIGTERCTIIPRWELPPDGTFIRSV